jgi:hypothetical protein
MVEAAVGWQLECYQGESPASSCRAVYPARGGHHVHFEQLCWNEPAPGNATIMPASLISWHLCHPCLQAAQACTCA